MAFRFITRYLNPVPSLLSGQSTVPLCDSTGALCVNPEGRKFSYRGAASGAVPVASLTNPFFTLTGSSTRIVRVTKIRFSASAATGVSVQFLVARYANILTGSGTVASTPAIASFDSFNPAATALCQIWSTPPQPTSGQTKALAGEQYEIITNSVSVLPQIVEYKFGDVPSQEVVLRGTTDSIGMQLPNPSAGTTPLFSGFFEWTEE